MIHMAVIETTKEKWNYSFYVHQRIVPKRREIQGVP